MKEYAIYPFRTMNITQNYNQGNHIPHWKGSKNYSDKPWDEACEDGGRSYFEPQNDFIIEEVLGLNSSTTNTVRLKSVNKLYTPFKNEADYLYITLTHMNEDNLRQVSKGQILSKESRVLLEGTDGNATGNHFHITANFGKYYGLIQNSNGKWCYTYEKSLLPEEAFYVDTNYTTIKNSNGSTFKEKPVEITKENELQNEINRLNALLNEKITQIQELEVKIDKLSQKEEIVPKFAYKALKECTYKIKLKENEELYIK